MTAAMYLPQFLVKHKLTLLRRVECDTAQFRSLVEEIANLLTYEATRDLPVEPCEIETVHGRVVSMPYTVELNDIPMMMVQHHAAAEFGVKPRRSIV